MSCFCVIGTSLSTRRQTSRVQFDVQADAGGIARAEPRRLDQACECCQDPVDAVQRDFRALHVNTDEAGRTLAPATASTYRPKKVDRRTTKPASSTSTMTITCAGAGPRCPRPSDW